MSAQDAATSADGHEHPTDIEIRFSYRKGGKERKGKLKLGADQVRAIFFDFEVAKLCGFEEEDVQELPADPDYIEWQEGDGTDSKSSGMRDLGRHPLCYFVGEELICP